MKVLKKNTEININTDFLILNASKLNTTGEKISFSGNRNYRPGADLNNSIVQLEPNS